MKSARACCAPPNSRTKLTTEQSVRFIVSRLRAKDPCYLRQLSWEGREFPIDRTICMLDVNDYSSTVGDSLGPPWPSRRRRRIGCVPGIGPSGVHSRETVASASGAAHNGDG